MPREIHSLVASIAQRLGRDVAGDDLFLLALMELPDDVPARSALEAEGVTWDRVLAEVGDKASDTFQGLLFPPAYNALLGRSQAFAATLGDGAITPEHILLALIWEPTRRLLAIALAPGSSAGTDRRTVEAPRDSRPRDCGAGAT